MKDNQMSLFDYDRGWNEAIEKVQELADVYHIFGQDLNELKEVLNELKK